MPKRTWSDANAHSPASSNSPFLAQYPAPISPARSYDVETVPIAPKKSRAADGSVAKPNGESPARGQHGSTNGNAGDERRMPTISRKVKACAACRKQKIKCIMAGEPPCQRCKERGLSCRLNKSLQTLMSEDSRWKSSVTKDIGNIYSSLEKVLQSMALPPLPPARVMSEESAMLFDQDDQDNEHDEDDPSYDNSPKVSPLNENLSHVPIESLYQITGMRALRAHEPGPEEQERICKQLRDTDFISKGMVSVEDAEYLTSFYLTRLDPYVWSLTGAYNDLDSFRRRSPTLTACVLTVAALHDTTKAHLYPICLKEYQRLVANAMFERRIDMEYLRALVIGSYWLSEIAFTLSGYAIRRASEFYLSQCYDQIVDAVKHPDKYESQQLQKAMDGLRLLYLLYICDHHLSILYGRPSIMRDNERCIIGWEAYLASPLTTDADKRIASQVSLVFVMNQIRESFGPEETASALPASAADKIASFERDLASWEARHASHSEFFQPY
jgi:Fungal Zn(2)-Cys(6) binuclear cluster domain